MQYMGEFDSIDDELFALDYRSERPVAHAGVLPEPPTVRLEERAPARVDLDAELDDEPSGEIAIVIAFAALLVVVLAAAGLVLWWWA